MQEKHQIILFQIEWSGSNKFNIILAASKALPLICQGHTGSHNIEAVWPEKSTWCPDKSASGALENCHLLLPADSAAIFRAYFQGTSWQTYGPRGPNIMTTFMPVGSRSMQWESVGRQPRYCWTRLSQVNPPSKNLFFLWRRPFKKINKGNKLHNQNRNL